MLMELLSPVFKIIEKVVPDTAERERIKKEITLGALENEQEYIRHISSVVIAEAQGESWVQRNWRPAMSWMLIVLNAWNYMIRPIFGAAFGVEIEAVPSDALTVITTTWAGAYGIGRTFEKTGSSIKVGGS